MNEQITDQQLNAAGHLTIGGCDAIDLAHRFGTPLVVYDVQQIRHQIRAFKQVFEENSVDYAVSYASKAFSAIAMSNIFLKAASCSDNKLKPPNSLPMCQSAVCNNFMCLSFLK